MTITVIYSTINMLHVFSISTEDVDHKKTLKGVGFVLFFWSKNSILAWWQREQDKCVLAGVKYYRLFNSKWELLRTQSTEFRLVPCTSQCAKLQFSAFAVVTIWTVLNNIRHVTWPWLLFSHTVSYLKKLFFSFLMIKRSNQDSVIRKILSLVCWLNMQVSFNNPQ